MLLQLALWGSSAQAACGAHLLLLLLLVLVLLLFGVPQVVRR
jgi:hypothetical protein